MFYAKIYIYIQKSIPKGRPNVEQNIQKKKETIRMKKDDIGSSLTES